MAHHFEFNVSVSLERLEGKFASRSDMEDALVEIIEGYIDGEVLDGLGSDGETSYEVSDFSVDAR